MGKQTVNLYFEIRHLPEKDIGFTNLLSRSEKNLPPHILSESLWFQQSTRSLRTHSKIISAKRRLVEKTKSFFGIPL